MESKVLTIKNINKFKVGSYYFVKGGYGSDDKQKFWITKIDEEFIQSIRRTIKYCSKEIINKHTYFEINSLEQYNKLKKLCRYADEWK